MAKTGIGDCRQRSGGGPDILEMGLGSLKRKTLGRSSGSHQCGVWIGGLSRPSIGPGSGNTCECTLTLSEAALALADSMHTCPSPSEMKR